MYRALCSPLRSLAGTLPRFSPSSYERGRSSIRNWLGCSCSYSGTKLTGNEFIGHQERSVAKSIQMQVLDALHAGERQRASSLLLKLTQENYLLKADDFFDILTYCARSPDPLFVMETWNAMNERGVGLDGMSLLLMIRALCNGGYLDEASHLITLSGENDGISPLLPVYNFFLGACAKTKSMFHARKCLDMMDRQRVGKNEITYSELLKLAVVQHNLLAAQEIWKEYIKHYSTSVLCLRKFIWSFTRLRDLKSAYEALQHMVALALRKKNFVKSNTEGKLFSSRLDIPIPSNGETELQKLDFKKNEHPITVKLDASGYNFMESNWFDMHNREIECSTSRVGLPKECNSIPASKVLRWSFSDVIRACGQAKNSKLAEQLMLQMQSLGLQPSSHTYDGFLRAVVSHEGYENGMALLRLMQQQNLKPYDSTLATLSAYCSKALEVDSAEILLNQISDCQYTYPFNNLLAACDTMDQPERAVRVLAKMKRLKLHPDIRTYELLLSLFGNVNSPYEEGNMLSQVDCAKRIHAIEMDMARNCVQHSHISMRNLLRALGAEGMVREMIQCLQKAENLFGCGNTHLGAPVYNIVLHSLVEAKESNMAIEIFRNMKSSGFPADAATYNIMIDCCSTIHSFKSACALVSLMIRVGFPPETVTFTALMKILLDDENFGEALNVLDQATSEEMQLDVLSYNTILRKACEKGRIDVVEYIVERMRRERICPDPTTCHFVFTSYVEQGFHTTALEALNVLSLRMLSEEDYERLQKEKTEFEEGFILSEDPEAESKIVMLFQNSQEHFAASLLNLRWCAILGFSVLYSETQSSWARRLSNKYS